jgi:hypothetical protein
MDTPRALQRSRRNQIASGSSLVVIGLVALALQTVQGPGRAVVLLLAGGAFIATYFYTELYALLVPGAILSGLGLGLLGEWWQVAVKDPHAIGLGIGFTSIYVIERAYRHRAHWWPLVPGGLLIVSGLGAHFGDVGHMLWRWAPAVLVLLGIVLVVRALRSHPGLPAGPA